MNTRKKLAPKMIPGIIWSQQLMYPLKNSGRTMLVSKEEHDIKRYRKNTRHNFHNYNLSNLSEVHTKTKDAKGVGSPKNMDNRNLLIRKQDWKQKARLCLCEQGNTPSRNDKNDDYDCKAKTVSLQSIQISGFHVVVEDKNADILTRPKTSRTDAVLNQL